MIIKTNLEIIKVKWTKEMNKNLLWFKLMKLDTRIWIEALGDGVQGYLRDGGGVGWERLVIVMSEYKLMPKFSRCLIQRHGVSIYRIQQGVKCVQVDGKDWILRWLLLSTILNYWYFVLNLDWNHVKSETVLNNNEPWTVLELLSFLNSILEWLLWWIIILISCPEQYLDELSWTVCLNNCSDDMNYLPWWVMVLHNYLSGWVIACRVESLPLILTRWWVMSLDKVELNLLGMHWWCLEHIGRWLQRCI